MDTMLRFCGAGVLCAVAALLLRQIKGEYALLVRVAGGILIFGAVLVNVGGVLSSLREIIEGNGLSPYTQVLIKTLGVAILTKICADICKDCGENTIASGVELGGKIAILALCIPLITELLEYALEMLKLE